MILGILSDTHGYFHPELPAALDDVDEIVHAGDIGDPSILDRLEALGPPVRAVFGNIDGRAVRLRAPGVQYWETDGVRFLMTHIAGQPGRFGAAAKGLLRERPADVLVCGHSHILRIERLPEMGGLLYLNPGAAGRQGFHRVKTVVRLHLDRGSTRRADVVHLDAPAETGKGNAGLNVD